MSASASDKPAASASAAASAAAKPAASGAAAAGNLKHLKVGTLPTIGNAPFIIATNKGYFKDEGIEGGLAYLDPNGAVNVAPLQPIVDFWIQSKSVQAPSFDVKTLVDAPSPTPPSRS